ncbi:23S rRNA (adenine(2503)-C(2))-methyltransferase RlmN [Pendulispora albinea]|uniref:Probable dual-specificity RNA methyltransferase RlmN n=1 Tax=Pendulispora albinea TaxID=2741071 RepID=A0ABZ2LKP0_9BACT
MIAKAETPPIARTPEEWGEAVRAMGGRGFHARQIFRWIHARGVTEPDKMSDLPGAMRAALTEGGLGQVVAIAEERRAADDTRKILGRLRDGATIETVLIPNVTGGKSSLPNPVEQDADASAAADDDEEAAAETGADPVTRVTQCISTQVGCAMGCVFCASGQAGLKRHLGADEIVAQVLLGRSRLDPGEQLRNVVYMGMGEPLHNYEATARSLALLTHQDGIGLSSRRVTVSTSGLVPEIERLGKDFGGNIGLAISLHAADDETRSRLLPINKKYPLPKLMAALRAYPLPSRRRITIEYTLVSGRNDNVDEARKLSRLLRGLPVKINLIPMNPISESALGPPDLSSVLAFQQVLCDDGYSCFIRRRRGDDVSAACGQLALAGAKRKIRLVG